MLACFSLAQKLMEFGGLLRPKRMAKGRHSLAKGGNFAKRFGRRWRLDGAQIWSF